MSEPKQGLSSLGLDNAIRLRWALRDIRANRLKLSPVDPRDLGTLIDMGYLEDEERGAGRYERGSSGNRHRRLSRSRAPGGRPIRHLSLEEVRIANLSAPRQK